MSKKYMISDLCNISDCLHVTPKYTNDGIPMVRVTEIKNSFLELEEALKVSVEDYNKYTVNYVPHRGDIILARVGAFLGEFSYVETNEKFCIGQNTTILNPKKHNKYIYYNLISPLTQLRLQREAAGSAYKSVGVDTIKNFMIELPDDEFQTDKIGELLFLIDKKIHLNKHIITELEELAQTIYDYWFVQFDFPNIDGKPYCLSGGEMIWNDQLKREIPKEWELKSLDCFVKVIRGVTYGKDDVSDVPKDGYTTLLRANNISNGTINYDSLVYVKNNCISDTQMLSERSIFISMSSGSKEHVGKTAIIPCNLNTSFGAFCSKIDIVENAFSWLAIYFRTEYFRSYIDNICLGTNINNLTNEHICSIRLPVPPQYILDEYNRLILPLINMQGNIHVENKGLIKLRDWLLPMLMNGQVTIE